MDLVSTLNDLGYASTFSSNVILLVFEQLKIYPSNAYDLNDRVIGGCLAMMSTTQAATNPSLLALTASLLSEQELAQAQQMLAWNVELFFPLVAKLVYSSKIEPKARLDSGAAPSRPPRHVVWRLEQPAGRAQSLKSSAARHGKVPHRCLF